MRLFIFLFPLITLASSFAADPFNSSLLIEIKRKSAVFTCSGVAVSPRLVITAAHCLEGRVERVRIFSQSRYHPENKNVEAKSYEIHGAYDPKKSQFKSDVAKVFLKEDLPSDIKTYPLFSQGTLYGKIYRLGFGGRANSNTRTKMTLELRNLKDNVLELNDKNSISGDSGGPIFLEQDHKVFLLAIHSTLSFGPEGKYSYNPLLAPFKDWIFKN